MPPINDNWANAIVLAASGGPAWYNNFGSSSESGEPASSGHTVWFQWTLPANFNYEYVFFDTRQPDNPTNTPYVNSTLQVFQGISVSRLTEQQYNLPGKTGYGGGGYSRGSYVIVPVPPAGGTLWIRIDGNPEGWFQLKWGPSNGKPMLGKCGDCHATLGVKVTCVATFEGPDLTTGDIRVGTGNNLSYTKTYWAVKRASVNLPGGFYLLRYCGGYYNCSAGSFTCSSWGGILSYAQLFPNHIATGWTLSPVPVTPTGNGKQAGDFSITSFAYSNVASGNVGEIGIKWWDGAQWQGTGTSGGPGFQPQMTAQTFDNGQTWNAVGLVSSISGMPQAPAISALVRPARQAAINSFIPSTTTFFSNPGLLQANYACETSLLPHTGGEMDWVMAVNVGADQNTPGTPPPDQFNVALGGSELPTGATVGPAGVPTYALMRINPDIGLIRAYTYFDDSGNNLTPNGQKNAVCVVDLQDNSVVGWNAQLTASGGFFVTQDPQYYPPSPTVFNIVTPGISEYLAHFVMTNSVGTFEITFTDQWNDFFPSFTITVTPLFKCSGALTRYYGQGGIASPSINGVPCAYVTLTINNIGNGTTVKASVNVTAAVGGQPVQITGTQFDNSIGPFGSSFTYWPYFGKGGVPGGASNPGPGLGVGWPAASDPSGGPTYIYVQVFVPMTHAPQSVVFTAAVNDGANTFPPGQVTILVPALPS